MHADPFHIILYDGFCNLCDGSVRWIAHHDKKGQFKYIALQSKVGKQIIEKLNLRDKEKNSVVYINHHGCYTRSSAVLEIMHNMDNGWAYFYFLRFIPKWFRNGIYDLIAKTRYQLFGKKEYCNIPVDLKRNRFVLSDDEWEKITKCNQVEKSTDK